LTVRPFLSTALRGDVVERASGRYGVHREGTSSRARERLRHVEPLRRERQRAGDMLPREVRRAFRGFGEAIGLFEHPASRGRDDLAGFVGRRRKDLGAGRNLRDQSEQIR
jgi:hypothetical protein